MMKKLSRREFLKSSGLLAGGVALPFIQDDPPPEPAPPPPITHWDGSPAGRILLNYMTVYTEPSWRAAYAGSLYYNNVVGVHGAVSGEGLYHSNHTWLQVDGGYIYSSWVQPVADVPINPTHAIPEGGVWGVVTVPTTWAKYAPTDEGSYRERVYYNQVGRVTAAENDYYLISEIYGGSYWLKAAHVRIVWPEEVGPISSHIPAEQKRIEISIRDQRLYAFEGENIVYSALASTGMLSSPTPFGEFNIFDKRHGQRMLGGKTGGAYNLAGVPYVCYFTSSWVATHGTYWHNDYGRQHSNGCLNLHPNDAKWLFRWTTPYANYWEYKTLSADENPGTKVIVKWA